MSHLLSPLQPLKGRPELQVWNNCIQCQGEKRKKNYNKIILDNKYEVAALTATHGYCNTCLSIMV